MNGMRRRIGQWPLCEGLRDRSIGLSTYSQNESISRFMLNPSLKSGILLHLGSYGRTASSPHSEGDFSWFQRQDPPVEVLARLNSFDILPIPKSYRLVSDSLDCSRRLSQPCARCSHRKQCRAWDQHAHDTSSQNAWYPVLSLLSIRSRILDRFCLSSWWFQPYRLLMRLKTWADCPEGNRLCGLSIDLSMSHRS